MIVKIEHYDNCCWFFHKWEINLDTGITQYMMCKKCMARKIVQDQPRGYQPVDWNWLINTGNRYKPNVGILQ